MGDESVSIKHNTYNLFTGISGKQTKRYMFCGASTAVVTLNK